MPYYCTVPRCTSMAGKAKNVSFHQFPRDEELAKLWNNILKRGKPYTKYSKVCSLHFKPEDYTITSVGKNKGQWRTLRKDAIPSQNLPSESPTPYQRKQWGSWTTNTPANVLDPTIQQQVAQAIYMQTMLAMQAAGAADLPTPNHNNGLSPLTPPLAHTSHTPDSDVLKGKHANTHEKGTPYRCTECSKCFKDPDVFTLHRRSHKNEKANEKENFNLNLTLRANPILANLLKTNTENANIFDNNTLSVETLLMTALAANMEGFMRNIMIKNGEVNDRSDSDHDKGDMDHDSDEIHSRDPDSPENCNDNLRNHSTNDISNSSNVRSEIDHDRGQIDNDKGDISLTNNRNDKLIRDRIIELYKHDENDRNIRQYENNSEPSDQNYHGFRIRDRGDTNYDADHDRDASYNRSSQVSLLDRSDVRDLQDSDMSVAIDHAFETDRDVTTDDREYQGCSDNTGANGYRDVATDEREYQGCSDNTGANGYRDVATDDREYQGCSDNTGANGYRDVTTDDREYQGCSDNTGANGYRDVATDDREYQGCSDNTVANGYRDVTNDDRRVSNDDIDYDGDNTVTNGDRGCKEECSGVINDDSRVSNDDDDDSQSLDGSNCDSDLNESIDSTKLVIDETD